MTNFPILATAGALLLAATPATAQHAGHMPGMSMPAPAAKSAPKDKAATSSVPLEAPPAQDSTSSASPEVAHGAVGHDMSGMAGTGADGDHAMAAALGKYPGTREA